MNNKSTRFFQRFVTLLLALSMVLSMPMGAVAAETAGKAAETTTVRDVDGDGVIKYVSLGDSVANGYGMEDYTYEDGTNVRGFRVQPKDSYPVLAAEAIEEMTGLEVELDQLAMSGSRAEDIYFLLDNDFPADGHHLNYFGDGKGDGYFKEAVEGWFAHDEAAAKKYEDSGLTYDQILRQEYQEAVATADLITINVGGNNFGIFMFNKLFDTLGATNYNHETDFTTFMDEDSAESIEAMLDQFSEAIVGEDEGKEFNVVRTILESLVYNYISYTHYFDAILEKIYAVNPNVQIVVMDMINVMEDVSMVGEVFGEFGDLSPIYAMFVDMANYYTKELTPYASRLTHVDLCGEEDEVIHLFFDYYKDYPDANYETGLNPDAYRLLNGSFQEFLGLTNEEMAAVMSLFDALDGIVNDVQAVVEEQLIEGAVFPAIVDGVQEAVDGVDAAIEGLKQAKEAVELSVYAVSMIPAALEGTAQAQELVDMVVELVLGNETVQQFFTGSQTSSMIKDIMVDTILEETADIDITAFGLEDTEENRQLLAEEVYTIACIYYDEINYNKGTEASANRLCVIEVIRFQQVHVEGASEADAKATGEMAYDMAYAYNTEFAVSGDEKKATIAALASQLDGDLKQGELAYELNEIYLAEGMDAAVDHALVSTVGEEQAALVYEINELVETEGRDAANLAALRTEIPDEKISTAFYAVYCHKTDGRSLSKENKELAIRVGLTAIMTEEEANSVYACYEGGKDGMYYDPDVKTTASVMLYLAGVFASTQEAADNYDVYILWRIWPSSFHRLTNCHEIYMDDLLAREQFDWSPLESFILATASLEMPVRAEGESDADYQARVDKFRHDSSVNLLYIRFITLTGALVHPSDIGHAYMADKLIAALENIKTPGTDTIPVSTSGLSLLSLGDSLASAAGLAEGELTYGALTAQSLGMEYTELAVSGLRLEDIRYILDSKYDGDDYAADLFGDDADDLADTLETAIADQDVILVNLGAMNLGYALNQMTAYQDGSAYSMTFEDIEALEDMDLGERTDAFLETFRKIIDTDEADALTTLLMGFESLGYGYTRFVDSLEETIELIREENEDALIVLVGQYDLLGESYYSDTKAGLDLDLGGFVGGISRHMNGYLETFAEMNSNVIYVDVTGTENSQSERGLNLAKPENCQTAMDNAHATADGHRFMAGQITLAFTEHVFPGELTWVWAEDGSEVSAYYHCTDCDQDIPVETTLVKTPTEGDCITGGKLTCTATATVNGESFTDVKVITMTPAGHDFTVAKWTWAEDYAAASLVLECSVCGEAKEPVKASVSTKTTDATCTTDGETVYTATAAVDGKNYTDTKTVVLKATGHSFGDWVITKEPTTTAKGERVRTCPHCGKKETETLPRLNNPFIDVKSTDYFFRPVLWAVEKGITAGTSDNTFGPNNPCTRGQVVTFLWRAAGSPAPESEDNPFTDVKKTDYFYTAVLWAVEKGITAGVAENKFGPGVVCTRAQVVTFLWRAAGSPEAENDKHTFTDVKETDYFHKAVLWAVENEITAGMSQNKFGSTNNCTRGQIVTFLYKAYAE